MTFDHSTIRPVQQGVDMRAFSSYQCTYRMVFHAPEYDTATVQQGSVQAGGFHAMNCLASKDRGTYIRLAVKSMQTSTPDHTHFTR